MENGVRKAVDGRNINHKGQGVWVSLKLLLGDIKQVITIKVKVSGSHSSY